MADDIRWELNNPQELLENRSWNAMSQNASRARPFIKRYLIDIVGTCNLRCPSCPVGNFTANDFLIAVRPKGFMAFELFKDIVDKIVRDNPNSKKIISLFNWGEPLLHPKIDQFITYCNDNKIRCILSTNLSHKNLPLEPVMKANPYRLRVSLSGFFAETYNRTHVRGDIELVRNNMILLEQYKKKYNSDTFLTVAYHLYKHNHGRDLDEMNLFCENHGYRLDANYASFYPLEKVMAYVDRGVSENDQHLIDNLIVDPKEELEIALSISNDDCAIQEMHTINYDGSVALCCATYDASYNVHDNFLHVSESELIELKKNSEMCDKCISGGYHNMMNNLTMDGKDEIARDRMCLSANNIITEKKFVSQQ